MGSYVTAMAGSQLLPEEDTHVYRDFRTLEWSFTLIFTVELILNVVAHWFLPFWKDAWNCFDFVVVGVSLLGLAIPTLPAIGVLRLMRIFKMVRLFKRAKSLRILISALMSSIVPVLNSFAILLLVTSVYAVVATDLFHTKSEYFVDFMSSMFTLFQMATGDSWSSVITRGLLTEYQGSVKGSVVLFFVSYVLVVGTRKQKSVPCT